MTAASPAAAASSATSLLHLLDDRASHTDIASFLDGLAPAARLEQVIAVRGKGVARLYEACEKAAPLAIEDMLPAGVEGTRIYEGRNSLPAFSRFQKRFTRLSSGQVIGYNHQTMAVVTGPGYFVVQPASGTGPKPEEMYFDYTAAPDRAPPGWPQYKPNEAGLSRLVYANMLDYMRRVARGVVVGMAYKNGKAEGAWFSLTYAG